MSKEIKIKPEILNATKDKKMSSSFSYNKFSNNRENLTHVATKSLNETITNEKTNSQIELIKKKTAEYKKKQQLKYQDAIYSNDIKRRKPYQPIEFISPLGGRSKKPKKIDQVDNFNDKTQTIINKANQKLAKQIVLDPQIANNKKQINVDLSVKEKIINTPIVDKVENLNSQKSTNLTDFEFIGEDNLQNYNNFNNNIKSYEEEEFEHETFDSQTKNQNQHKKYYDDSYKVYESFIEKVSNENISQNNYLKRKSQLLNKIRNKNNPFKYFQDEDGFVFSNATKVFLPQIMPILVQKQTELVKIDEDVKHYTGSIETEFLEARKNHKENKKRILEHQKKFENNLNLVEKRVEKLPVQETTIEQTYVKQDVNYTLPSLLLLNPVNKAQIKQTGLKEKIEQLETFFKNFKISARVENSTIGPTVARFELSIAAGTKVSKISNLKDDIKLALASKDVRIEAPIPGKNLIGIEIPAMKSRTINIKEIIQAPEFKQGGKLEAALGLSIDNIPTFLDIASMPHGLISGSTGSGKSVSINAILISLLYKNTPDDLKLILVDPKVVELSPYNGIPHLLSPVISDPKEALNSLKWAAQEMDRRYNLFAQTNTRNLESFNKISDKKMSKIVIVIDELADLMMVASNEVEVYITRIAQKSRAAGIHMILATQRPSVEVITGLIKANIPTRIAFAVSSSIDSRTILDSVGAESLLGKGDMLFSERGKSPIRLQAPYITDDEITKVIQHWQNYRGEENIDFNENERNNTKNSSKQKLDSDIDQVAEFIISTSRASTSLIQRKFSYGYNKAARIIDQLEELGVIGAQNGTKPREVFLDYDQYLEKRSEYERN